MANSSDNLDDFLGAPPTPWYVRYGKWIAIAIGVILLLLLLNRLIFGGATATQYATETAQTGNLTVSVSATGKLAPTNQVIVGSQLSGLVTKVVVDDNDRVTAGQALALIDPSQFQDQVKQAQATLSANISTVGQMQATLAQNEATLARYQEVSKLSGGRVPAKTEMDQAIADRQRAAANLHAAQANVVSARAALSSAQTQLTKAVIRSPVNGVVLARVVQPGQTVAASFSTPTLFVIAQDLSQMKLEVAIDEADVGQVKQGQDATFTVDAFPGKTFPAKITRVEQGSNLTVQDATASSSSSTTTSSTAGQVVSYAADLSVSNPDLQLRPGMTATADITTSQKSNVLLVPNAALRFKPTAAADPSASSTSGGIAGALVPRRPRRGSADKTASVSRGGKQVVYIKGADGKPQAISVVTGLTNGTMTEITGGDLKPGMEVITGQLASGAQASGGGSRRRGAGAGGAGGGQGGGARGGQ
jgi:HlyD family secretion protein